MEKNNEDICLLHRQTDRQTDRHTHLVLLALGLTGTNEEVEDLEAGHCDTGHHHWTRVCLGLPEQTQHYIQENR